MVRIKSTPKKNAHSIPRASFLRLVRELAAEYKSDLRFSADAIEALQGDSELFLEEHFGRARELSDRFHHSTVSLRHFERKDPPHQPVAQQVVKVEVDA